MMVTSLNSFPAANTTTQRKAKVEGQMEHRSKSYSSTTGSPPAVDSDFDDLSRGSKRTPKACDRCRHKKTKVCDSISIHHLMKQAFQLLTVF